MLRNAIIHIANEQPLMADLVVEPSTADACLLCRNIRTMNGTKPVFVDYADSTFLLPINQIRFVEIPAKAYLQADEEARVGGGDKPKGPRAAAPVSLVPGNVIPLTVGERPSDVAAVAGGADMAGDPGSEQTRTPARHAPDDGEPDAIDEGLDSDLLRRIREI